MPRLIVSRVVRTALTLLVVVTAAFALAHLTGDPTRLLLPQDATAAQVTAYRHQLGLDRPMIVQYFDYLGQALRGNLGTSITQQQPAAGIVFQHLPATLGLALLSFAVGLVLAMGLAVLVELSGSTRLRSIVLWGATLRQAIPPYLFAVIAVLVFSVTLGVLPTMGRASGASYVLPVATLSTIELALYLRLLLSSFDDLREQDFLRTARASGASEREVVLKHQLPNALLPLMTVAGVNLGTLLGGTVVVEVVFNWPGMGRLIVDSVLQRDFPIVQAGVIVIAALFVLVNLVVDLLYSVVDPRIRVSA